MVYSATGFPPRLSQHVQDHVHHLPLSTLFKAHRLVPKAGQGDRGGPAGDLRQLIQGAQALPHLGNAQAVEYAVTELKGAGGGDKTVFRSSPVASR